MIEARTSGLIGGELVLVKGFWSGTPLGFSCQRPDDAQPIELMCSEGTFGITDSQEPLLVLHPGGWERADLVHITPYVPDESILGRLLSPGPGKDEYPAPRAVVARGQFDHPEAEKCVPERIASCRGRFVIDAVVELGEARFIAVDRAGQRPDAAAVFEAAVCAGDVAYSHVGWSTLSELGLDDRFPDDLVYAMVTAGPVPIGDSISVDDTGLPYRTAGRLACFARSYKPGFIEFVTVGEAMKLYEDGLLLP